MDVHTITKQGLIDFEAEIAELFNAGKITSPVHLSSGNEDSILEVFKSIDVENDWVCCTWRNHYQGLLKGVPITDMLESILAGKSMVLNFPEYKFICSSIVGGVLPIATGIALAIKLQNKSNRVWCWVGDMSSHTGAFHEAHKYSVVHKLPITFIVEDNEKSVCTPTKEVWGSDRMPKGNIISYKYTNEKYPHAGAGKRVQF